TRQSATRARRAPRATRCRATGRRRTLEERPEAEPRARASRWMIHRSGFRGRYNRPVRIVFPFLLILSLVVPSGARAADRVVATALDKLDLVIDLEADRMQNLLLDPKEIASEREVVIEERRTRTEDDPGGYLGEEVSSIAFKAHPYGVPIIGWMEDIKRITPAEIRAFYKTYYVPNNAIVVAVGAFKAADALEKIRRRFGRIPRGKVPPPVLTVGPPQH